MTSPKRRDLDPSLTVHVTGGGIAITAAGPVAMIRAFAEGRQVVLRADLARGTMTIDLDDEPEVLPPPVDLGPPVVTAREPMPDFQVDAVAMAGDKPGRKKRVVLFKATREALAHADEKVRELHAKGWTDTAIAKAAGVSVSFARTRRVALGLATNFKSALAQEDDP